MTMGCERIARVVGDEDSNLRNLEGLLRQEFDVENVEHHKEYSIGGICGEEDLAVDLADGRHFYVEYKRSLRKGALVRFLDQSWRFYATHPGRNYVCILATPANGTYALREYQRWEVRRKR